MTLYATKDEGGTIRISICRPKRIKGNHRGYWKVEEHLSMVVPEKWRHHFDGLSWKRGYVKMDIRVPNMDDDDEILFGYIGD